MNGTNIIQFQLPNLGSNNLNNTIGLKPGDFITRVPHKVALRVEKIDGKYWLVMDRFDIANQGNERFVRIGRLACKNCFEVEPKGRSIRIIATFRGRNNREYKFEEIFGRRYFMKGNKKRK